MTTGTSDLAGFLKTVREELLGIVGTYDDNTKSTGKKYLDQIYKVVEQVFDSKLRKYDSITFARININEKETSYIMYQPVHASKPTLLTSDCTFEEFISLRHKLAWLTHKRLTFSSSAAIMA